MKTRIARFATVLVPALALIGSMAPPAGATEVGVLLINGSATVGNGIAYPCLDGKTTPPTVNPAKCTGPVNNPGQTANVNFTGQAVGVVAKIQKDKCTKDPTTKGTCVEVGTAGVQANGTVTGACGFSTGALTGVITPQINLGTKNVKPRTFTVSYTGVGGTLVLSGTTNKGETLAGAVLAVPTTGTCLNKTPKVFTVAGAVAVFKFCGDNLPGCP